ncbi:hypothetical protein SAMN05660420_01691 [Desulfuromusa kysingii]|uniref:AEC family transporter n=1 Tax=Desulfuromusa kysingii TaxID=37625 RepID=A0A1H3ZWD0_9BACT|nr:AEC family transporter [Desulfuromusa kysingii]SEA27602.1 hypothetical protein SAMN05660420_01691 [Desulfuromusa kysingii]
MDVIFFNILPLMVTFFLGVTLKRCGVFAQNDAQHFLKLFFYVSLPALILLSVTNLTFDPQWLFLPLSAIIIIFSTYLIASGYAKARYLHKQTFAVFLLGAMIMNGGFSFPFILASYGQQGMALASLFDTGGALIVFTFVYYQACRYGQDGTGGMLLLRKFFLSPPLLALFTALVLNFTGLQIGATGIAYLKPLADLTTPVVLLALGIAFNPRIVQPSLLLTTLLIRMIIGFLLGYACCELFQLQGLARSVTLIMASAPSGMNTLVFSSMEELDTAFAASVVSYATLLGMLWTPFLIYMQR